ncbi:MAG: hypothetical protein QOJ94_2982 [Sphingomonadales bacterium]|nr:hypothetical protein [Sphingomonadales bacterium]
MSRQGLPHRSARTQETFHLVRCHHLGYGPRLHTGPLPRIGERMRAVPRLMVAYRSEQTSF